MQAKSAEVIPISAIPTKFHGALLTVRRVLEELQAYMLSFLTCLSLFRIYLSPSGVRCAVEEARSRPSAAHGRRLLLPCLHRGEIH